MTVFIILLALGACVVFPLYCALVVASREDDRLEKWDTDPPRTGHRRAKMGRPEKGRTRKLKKSRREIPPPPHYGDEDRKN